MQRTISMRDLETFLKFFENISYSVGSLLLGLPRFMIAKAFVFVGYSPSAPGGASSYFSRGNTVRWVPARIVSGTLTGTSGG